MKDVLVVKFGGSSIASTDLRKWVEAIEKSKRRLVVVPRGGPFAKLVRQYQTRIGYDDDAAHRMAILGMEQFGHALASLARAFARRDAGRDRRRARRGSDSRLDAGQARDPRRRDRAHLEHHVGQSLAAWLAGQFEGASLCPSSRSTCRPAPRSRPCRPPASFDNPSLPAFLHPATRVFVAGPSDLAIAGRRLAEGPCPAAR